MKRQDDFQEKISPDSKLDIFYGMYTRAFIFPVWFKQIAKHITGKKKKKLLMSRRVELRLEELTVTFITSCYFLSK